MHEHDAKTLLGLGGGLNVASAISAQIVLDSE